MSPKQPKIFILLKPLVQSKYLIVRPDCSGCLRCADDDSANCILRHFTKISNFNFQFNRRDDTC